LAKREIKTFSAIVDSIIARTGRIESRADIEAFVRLSIRETQVLAFFNRDLMEEQLQPSTDPFVWPLPDRFRQFRAVEYPTQIDSRGNTVFPDEIVPGLRQQSKRHYYYHSGDSVVFVGHAPGLAANGVSLINLAYYRYFLPLVYMVVDSRPARYLLDDTTGLAAWEFNAIGLTPEQEAAKKAQVTNWLIFNWDGVIEEGGLAKLYKSIGDERASASFSLYKQLQRDVIGNEAAISIRGPTRD